MMQMNYAFALVKHSVFNYSQIYPYHSTVFWENDHFRPISALIISTTCLLVPACLCQKKSLFFYCTSDNDNSIHLRKYSQ